MANTKMVYGVGINDSDYPVQKYETLGYNESGKRIQRQVWSCPYYRRWVKMLERCYSDKWHIKQTSYIGCSVSYEWQYFMTFRSWMEKQDWEGKQLDKDLLVRGNKIYSPETCVFIDEKVNKFLQESKSKRGEWPIGVCFHKQRNKFVAVGADIATGKQKYLGLYTDALSAHKVWLDYKLEQAKILASQQTDPRIAKALIERYENYEF